MPYFCIGSNIQESSTLTLTPVTTTVEMTTAPTTITTTAETTVLYNSYQQGTLEQNKISTSGYQQNQGKNNLISLILYITIFQKFMCFFFFFFNSIGLVSVNKVCVLVYDHKVK